MDAGRTLRARGPDDDAIAEGCSQAFHGIRIDHPGWAVENLEQARLQAAGDGEGQRGTANGAGYG